MVNTRKIDIGRQESSPSRNIVLFSLMMYVDCRKERKNLEFWKILSFIYLQVLAPENEAFRLGIQKCHNTITDNVKDGEVFKVSGASILFRMLCSAQELHSDSSGVHKSKRAPTLKGLLTNMAIKKEEKGPDGCETGGKTLGIY